MKRTNITKNPHQQKRKRMGGGKDEEREEQRNVNTADDRSTPFRAGKLKKSSYIGFLWVNALINRRAAEPDLTL